MGKNTGIAWTTHTFNPWVGCTRVSQGCKFCYAAWMMEERYRLVTWGDQGTRMIVSAETWRQPFGWHKQACRDRRTASVMGHEFIAPRVFCASVSDFFEDWQGLIRHGKARTAMFCENQHTSGIPMAETADKCPLGCGAACRPMTMNDARLLMFKKTIDETPYLDWLLLTKRPENIDRMWHGKETRKNVWLGTSVEDQDTAVFRIPHLIENKKHAAKIFLSVEPLLAPVDIRTWLPSIDWVIVGAESGKFRRPCEIDWIRSVRDQCREFNVPVYIKQVQVEGKLVTMPNQFPIDLEVREFPPQVKREVAA